LIPALGPGTRLGPYEIIAAIGAGGMGEVYRARDSRLGREVAIKVLPPALADDRDRRARFEREAHAVAALSHPNVIAIFDTGLYETQLYVVMELLSGHTLREAMAETGASAPLPVRKAVDIAVQIARGLGAAHGKGIVHRDLKPENIFLLDDGQVKILDFGLAQQAVVADHPGATQTLAATDPGTVMGTVGYMAPEQVRGQAVDARADLFAFGAVLYEMVSGQRAFKRDTAADTMTAILTQDPPELVGSRPDLSPALDRIIRHCLEKNANERFQSARDVAFALEALSGSQVMSASVPAAPRANRWRRPVLTAALVAAAFAGGVLASRQLTPSAAPITFETKTLASQWITRARFGPDGQTIVFSAAASGNVPELFVLRAGATIPERLGQQATHLLSVSSKGELAVLTGARYRHHAVFDGTLARMALDGAPKVWVENVREADWSPDGSTLAIVRVVDGQHQLEYPIGNVLYRFPGYLSDPRVSPDGKQVAFMEHQVPDDDRGWVKVVGADKAVKTLAGEYWGEESLSWSRDGGHLYFAASKGGNETYQPIVVNVNGRPQPRQTFSSPGAMLIEDLSPDGRQLVMRLDRRLQMRILMPGDTDDRDAGFQDFAIAGSISPDRKSLLFTDLSATAGTNYATALRDIASGKVVRLGEGASFGFSGDGSWAGSQVPSSGEILLFPLGAGETVRLPRGNIENYVGSVPQWFPSSRRLLVCGNERGRKSRCYAQDAATGALTPLTPEGVESAFLTRDERTLLTKSNSGSYEVRGIGSDQASPARGFTPTDKPIGWSNDGRSVVVTTGGQIPARVERVDVSTGARTFLRELTPPDRAGLTAVELEQWIDDGRGYVFRNQRTLSTLFVATGVR
jgi:Tol biopolymer transport system component